MVSNTIDMTLEDLLATLERLRVEHGSESDYVELRKVLPEEWPL